MTQPVTPYGSSDSKKNQVSTMFNRIASSYDLLNRLTSFGIDVIWRKKAIAHLNPQEHRKILDVATGTADVALEIRRQLPEVEHITGLDISAEMLVVGREKIARKAWDKQISLIEGDSEDLPFEDNTFDAVTVAFGVRNFEHLEKGLAEIYRVLRPGGKLVVLEFSHPTVFPIKQLFNFYFRYILPFVGRVISKDEKAYTYLYDSVQAFLDQKAFLQQMSSIGYKSNQCKSLTFGISSLYIGIK
ncbi:MAG: bifunctional demethylmenaquinone methyltransferase/2-methoxy-6-polyprenyl-1,4-benzoquinol methylase UbiE [Saprospiraceae bacterium]